WAGPMVRFALDRPAVRGITFQPAFRAQRHIPADPLQRMTIPDVLGLIEAQTDGLFTVGDFVPVPCCFPTCNAVTYAYVEGESVVPLPRVSTSRTIWITSPTGSRLISTARSRPRCRGCGHPRRCPARRR